MHPSYTRSVNSQYTASEFFYTKCVDSPWLDLYYPHPQTREEEQQLLNWIKEKGGPVAAALILKENPRTVWSWYRGEKIPKPQTAQRIIRLTKGELDYNRIYATTFARMAEAESKALLRG